MNPIEVCLTIDIEFDINGALTYPERRSPLGNFCVFRPVNGISQGLDPLLSDVEKNGLSATFFIESLQTCYFGKNEMSAVLNHIRSKISLADFQLHLHPEWLMLSTSDWRMRVRQLVKNGSMVGRETEAKNIILDGYDYFLSLTGRPPVALRTGGLQVDLNVYKSQQEIGIPLASSVGVGVYLPPEPELNLFGGLKHIGEITEVPVFSYNLDFPGRTWLRLFSITGNSFRTCRAILEWAYSRQVSPLIILTHASEFAYEVQPDPVTPIYAANHINQHRWTRLCKYLCENHKRFKTVTFGDCAVDWVKRSDYCAPEFSRNILAELASRALEYSHRLIKKNS